MTEHPPQRIILSNSSPKKERMILPPSLWKAVPFLTLWVKLLLEIVLFEVPFRPTLLTKEDSSATEPLPLFKERLLTSDPIPFLD